MNFIDGVIKKAALCKKKIVLPEAADIRILKAACIIQQKKIADVILVGKKNEMENILGENLPVDITTIDPKTFNNINEYANTLYEFRKNKGLLIDEAKKLILDPLYFGVMLVKMKQADGMVAGAANATAKVLRPALQILKTAKGTKFVSSFFIMEVPDCDLGEKGIFLFSDCALIEDPDSDMLSEIAISSAGSFEFFTGCEAKVAMLSYSTHGSAKSELTNKVAEATKLAKEKVQDLQIDGEIQVDAAIIDSVAKQKAKGSTIAGKCNTLIFPDLNCGNISYKLVQRLAKAAAYGPITQGLAYPVNDLSRGCSVEDIIGVVAVTSLQARTKEVESL